MSQSRRHRPLSLLALLAALAVAGSAWGQSAPKPPHAQRRPAQHDPGQRALSDAVRRAERAGQVLSAEHVQYDGRDVNRVKIVDDRGRVRVYWDDPAREGDEPQDAKTPRRPAPPQDRTRHDDDDDPTL